MSQKTYDRQTAKFLAVVGENIPELSGQVMQDWIENPRALQKFLAGLCPPPPQPVPELKIWKTITLGTGLKNADAFIRAFNRNSCKASPLTKNILGKSAFKVAKKKTKVDLVNLSVAELGFNDGVTTEDIYERAQSLGLQLCPNEVGPQLRLQYKDQPEGEWLLVAMEPIIDLYGNRCVFDVYRNNDELWLSTGRGKPDSSWRSDDQWVFLRSKNLSS